MSNWTNTRKTLGESYLLINDTDLFLIDDSNKFIINTANTSWTNTNKS